MPNRPTRVVSNFKRMGRVAAADPSLSHEYLGEEVGAVAFLRKCLGSDLVILNIDQKRLMLACLLLWLWPAARFRLVSADLILRPPKTLKDRVKVFVKRVLFSRVHRFALYFKDLEGYERFYGIGPDRVTYVRFKVNGWDEIEARGGGDTGGSYVLCAGRTLRDVGTFVEAMRRAGPPAMLLQQSRELLNQHGTSGWEGELPSNVRLVVDESDSLEAYLDFISGARLVVIPRFRGDIAPTGISTYLVAMALGKSVIISAGPRLRRGGEGRGAAAVGRAARGPRHAAAGRLRRAVMFAEAAPSTLLRPSPKSGRARRALLLTAALAVVAWPPLAWGAALWLAAGAGPSSGAANADALAVLAGSSTYVERARLAAALFREGRAPLVLLTDDNLMGGWSEAEQRNPLFVERAAGELRRAGVPAAKSALISLAKTSSPARVSA
jgi:hypothetical protein